MCRTTIPSSCSMTTSLLKHLAAWCCTLPSLVLTMATLTLAPSASAQAAGDTSYTPSYALPQGRQIVAVYLGALTCRPCGAPEMKAAVRRMKPLLAAQAKHSGSSFAATVVANDWDLKSSLEFVQPLGAFDEYLLGGNWVSVGAQRFFWSDSLTTKAMPQVLLIDRTVTFDERGGRFGPEQVIHRIVGDSIIKWVRAGAPINP